MEENAANLVEPIRPQKIGTYLIERTIGKGNFSVVKLARHTITQLKVAIKIIDKTRLSAENLKKVQREVAILKFIQHPNIIKLYQVMETTKLLCIVTEYLPNGELFEYIAKNGRIPENVARLKFTEILSAVEHCHRNNIVHRDLKAENMLLDQSNTIKLADFGFGTFQPQGLSSLLTTWCGSPPYAAPEIFKGEPYVGTKADIWSLGVLLYVIVVGFLPFGASELPKLRDQVLTGTFRVPFWLSCSCEELLRAMLAKSPYRRPSIDQLYHFTWLAEVSDSTLSLGLNGTHSSVSILPSSIQSLAPFVSSSKPRSNSNVDQPTFRNWTVNPTRPNLAAEMKMGNYDQLVIQVMENNGMSRDRILESLTGCAYDHLTATYLLLGERLQHTRYSLPQTLAPQLISIDASPADPYFRVHNDHDPHQSAQPSYRTNCLSSPAPSYAAVPTSDLVYLNAIFPPKCTELKSHSNCISVSDHTSTMLPTSALTPPCSHEQVQHIPSRSDEINCAHMDEPCLASLPLSVPNSKTVREDNRISEAVDLSFSSSSILNSPIDLRRRRSPSITMETSASSYQMHGVCVQDFFPSQSEDDSRLNGCSSSRPTASELYPSLQRGVDNLVVCGDRKSTKTRRLSTDQHDVNYEHIAQRLISCLYPQPVHVSVSETRDIQPIISDYNPPTEDQTSGVGSSFDIGSRSGSSQQSPNLVRGSSASHGEANVVFPLDDSFQTLDQRLLPHSKDTNSEYSSRMASPTFLPSPREHLVTTSISEQVFHHHTFRRKIGVVSRPVELQAHVDLLRRQMFLEE